MTSHKYYSHVAQVGNSIFVRGYEDGKRIQKKVKYKPYLFLVDKSATKYKTIFGKSVKKISFENIAAAKEFEKKYTEVDNFEVFGYNKYSYTYINDVYKNELNITSSDLNIGYMDIEVAKDANGFADVKKADKPVTAITIKRRNLIMSFACGEFDAPDDVIYVNCKDEEILLRKFLKTWEYLDLDIISGWNVEGYDIPYLLRRIARILGEDEAKRMSPWGMIDSTKIQEGGKLTEVPTPRGIEVLDYLTLYKTKKFQEKQRESYTLNYIAHVELDEQKVDYSEYSDLQELYEKDFQKFLEYNIQDVRLVEKLEEKLGLIELVITFAYDAKINFTDTYGTVQPWDVIIHNYLMERNVVIPQYKRGHKEEQFKGAIVFDTKVGSHDWIVSFDVSSLYPSLMVQYNMSPETIRKKIHPSMVEAMMKDKITGIDKKLSYAANGLTFTNEFAGFIPSIIRKELIDRSVYKKKMIDAEQEYERTKSSEAKIAKTRYFNLQWAKKIRANALYGALGNIWSRWFNLDYAEAITVTGQMVLQYIRKSINELLNTISGKNKEYAVAGDTDSLYLCLEDFGNSLEEIDQFCKDKIEPELKLIFNTIAERTNAFTNFISMKREVIASRGIFVAKKNYILNMLDKEGVRYKEPEIYMKGISAIKSSTPSSCRDAIKESIKIIMNKDNDTLIEYIDDFKDKFMELPFNEIAFPRGCNGLEKFFNSEMIYNKSTPIHVRGALLFNKLLIEKGLDRKYQKINSGDKVKFIYLKVPNPIKENVISVPENLYSDLGLDAFVDKEQQFQKAFLHQLEPITSIIGWELEYRNTLDAFF